MNFMQASGQNNGQPLPIARIGMSKEHAEKVIAILQKALSTQQNVLGQQNSKKSPTNSKKDKKEDQ